MFTNFVNNSLSLNEYLKKNKEASDGYRYCNGLCSNYLPEDNFFKGKGKLVYISFLLSSVISILFIPL